MAWIVLNLMSCVFPTNQAIAEVSMNSAIVVRAVGTPTFLLAFGSPPEAKIQFPNRVWVSSHEPMMVKMIHQRIAIWNFWPPIEIVLTEDIATRGTRTRSRLLTCTVLVTCLVTPRLMPCRARNMPSVMMKLGNRCGSPGTR